MISIIVPVYNVESYLERCIRSIISQSYKDFELILVDDGSPDKSPLLCDEYANKYQNIKVIHKKNGGLSSARNAGLDIANGEFILFVDSDDYLAPDCLKILLSKLYETNSDVVIGSIYIANENQFEKRTLNDLVMTGNELLVLSTKYCNGNSFLFTTSWGKLYKKNVFNSLRFKEGHNHEDEFMKPILYHRDIVVACCSEPVYYYFINNNGINANNSIKNAIDSLDASLLMYRTLLNIDKAASRDFLDTIYMCIRRLINCKCPPIELRLQAKKAIKTISFGIKELKMIIHIRMLVISHHI